MRGIPSSLSFRLFLILMGAVVLAVLLTAYLAEHDRSRALRHLRLHAAISHLADAITLLAPLSPADRARVLGGLSTKEWSFRSEQLPLDANSRELPELAWVLDKRLQGLAYVESGWVEQPAACDEDPGPCLLAANTAVVDVRFNDGQRLRMGYRRIRERPPPHEQRGFLAGVTVFAVTLAAASWWAVRLALRPLRRMARAAEDVGRDIAHAPMDESGPREVRQAAQAFNAMQARIRENLAERTRMLAAITHDLKTPLTRMQLRLEQAADPALQAKLKEDLVAMRRLVDEGLELARSLETAEALMTVDLGALLQSVCDDAADAGLDVRCAAADWNPPVLVLGRPHALRRVFDNLIDNAVNYGRCARVELMRCGETARVLVRDRGPGIAERRLVDVLQPFTRIEDSRSRETGGTGLGLAIAANLLASQQGRVTLRNHPDGGLEAQVELPLASCA